MRGGGRSCARCSPTVVDLDEGGARVATEVPPLARGGERGAEEEGARCCGASGRRSRTRSACTLDAVPLDGDEAVSLSSLVETLRSVHLHETNNVADLNEATKRHREEKVLGRGVGRMAHHHRAAGAPAHRLGAASR